MGKSVISGSRRSAPQRQYLRMPRRIVQADRTVMPPRQDFPFRNQNRPNWNLALFSSPFGLLKSHLHEKIV
jgi:hypothetical protein